MTAFDSTNLHSSASVSPTRWAVVMIGAGLLGMASTILAMLLWRENPTATHIAALDSLVAPGIRVAARIMRATRSLGWSGARMVSLACVLNGWFWALAVAIVIQGWRLMVNTERGNLRDLKGQGHR